jgi:tetratricopeptide (TPR) repeat protein
MNAAAIFYQLGDYAKATLYLKRALELKPRDADALVAMGDTRYDAGSFAEAADFYQRALKQRPDDVNVRTDLGNTYFKRTPPDYRQGYRALQIRAHTRPTPRENSTKHRPLTPQPWRTRRSSQTH